MRDTEHTIAVEGESVSARLQRPDGATCLVVFGHGAGSNREHATMTAIADALIRRDIAVYRYNFPYSERGSRRIDPRPLILATVPAVITHAMGFAPDLPVFAGGHSFGGRMTSTVEAQQAIDDLKGLVFCSFPLHPAGKPSIDRATHLEAVEIPMLFLSGTRDRLAQVKLLEGVCGNLSQATLHWLDTADHGYRVLKRRESDEPVFEEMARVTEAWITGVLETTP
jgi:predicted alpha/beta-hydrolase family hydrolase